MSLPRGLFPTDYAVGDYIGDNFLETKRYIQVLHQNGRAIYNVDQNEKQSINDTWKRRIMQNLMGDASVEDAFQIIGTGADNDFQIVGGDNAPATPKNAFVGGFMPIADANTTYLLHNNQYNEDLGTVPAALTTPAGGNRVDEVYLDVYLKEVTYLDDGFLVPDNLKTGLTTRLRLIQEVKVAEGGSVPATPFVGPGGTVHHYFHLATINRIDGQDAINALDVVDQRRTMTFGTLANGGLGLTDPGGMQSAIDNTSGGIPSAVRHVLLGTDFDQAHIDSGIDRLENYSVFAAGDGPDFKSPDSTVRKLTNENSGRMAIDGLEIALLNDVPLVLEDLDVGVNGEGPNFKSPDGLLNQKLTLANSGRMAIDGNEIALFSDTVPTAGPVLLFGRVTSGGAIDLNVNDGSAATFSVAMPGTGIFDVSFSGISGNVIVVVVPNSNDNAGGSNRHGGLFGVTQLSIDVASFPLNTGFRAVFQRLFHQSCGGCPYMDNGAWSIPFSFIVYQA